MPGYFNTVYQIFYMIQVQKIAFFYFADGLKFLFDCRSINFAFLAF